MKNMKRVFLCLGMSSCVSTKSVEPTSIHTLEKVLKTVDSPVWEPPGSKEEAFFDSKPWLESDDESDYFSVNGDIPPFKQSYKDGDHQGRKLSELFKEGNGNSFSSESQASVVAANDGKEKDDQTPTSYTSNDKSEKGKSGKSVKQHCLPSLVRSLSCGDRKKRPKTGHMAIHVAS